MLMNAPDPSTARTVLRVVLIADQGLPTEIALGLADDLPGRLRQHVHAETDWRVRTVTAPLVADEQVDVSGMVDAVRPHLASHPWDMGIFITDLPRRAGLRPVTAEVSRDDHVALISLPALGSLRLAPRVTQAVVAMVRKITPISPDPGQMERDPPVVIGHRTTDAHLSPQETTSGRTAPDRYVLPGLHGHLRLIAGMVHANRPWRLFITLSRALAGVFATAAFCMVNSTTWQLATALAVWKLVLSAVLSVLALTAWIIVDHELWERPSDDLSRVHARLYNLVTAVTIALGVLCLYTLLFGVLTSLAALLLDSNVLGQITRQHSTTADYLAVTSLATSIAMIGGAFGSGLEDDGTVRNAAYGNRQRSRRERQSHNGEASSKNT